MSNNISRCVVRHDLRKYFFINKILAYFPQMVEAIKVTGDANYNDNNDNDVNGDDNNTFNINNNKQRVLMHRHQRWNVRHGLCHIYMRYIYIYMSCL